MNNKAIYNVGDMVFANNTSEFYNGYITSSWKDEWNNEYIEISSKNWICVEDYNVQTFNLKTDKEKLFPLLSF